MHAQDFAVLLLTIGLIYLAKKWNFRRRSARFPLPPQPPGHPIIGNLVEMQAKFGWLQFVEWGRNLNSDLVYANVLGAHFLIINSFERVVDLLDKRSGIYSSRPPFVLIDEIMGWGFILSIMPYGDRWRERRRLLHQHLRPQNSVIYRHRIIDHIRRSMIQLKQRPTDSTNVIQHTIGGFAISLAYGLDIHPYNDPYVRFIDEALTLLNEAGVAGSRLDGLITLFPSLKHIPAWFPGAKFKRDALNSQEHARRFRERPFVDAEAKIAASQGAPDSFLSVALEQLAQSTGKDQEKLDVIKDTVAVVYAGGAETITTTLIFWIRAMLVHPDVQRRVQQELDEVLQGRLPEFSDEESLPWLRASIMESLRCYTSAPTGVPHASTGDDVYDGYFIPKGTIVIANAWAMLHDENWYPNAMTYNPGRFIKDNKINAEVRNPSRIAFGFGRRECPGMHIAQDALFVAAGTILSLFDICKAVNDIGEPIEPDMGPAPGVISHAIPFECVFSVRNEVSKSVLSDIESTYY